ncbi:MAG: vWA domain-containing protein, partial [Planctomycetota bacterium]
MSADLMMADGHPDHEREDDSLLGTVHRQLHAAPWYMGSTVVHMVLLLLMMLVPTVHDPVVHPPAVIIHSKVEQIIPQVQTIPSVPQTTPQEVIEAIRKQMDPVGGMAMPDSPQIEPGVTVKVATAVDVPPSLGPTLGGPASPSDPVDNGGEGKNLTVLTRKARDSGFNGPGNRGPISKVKDSMAKLIPSSRSGRGKGLCLVWLLDRSASMKDDQEALAKQARDIQDLLSNGGRRSMLSGVVTYGKTWSIAQPLTTRESRITDAILNVEVDESGVENTNQAIIYTCERIMARRKGWTKVIVLLSDESSSDQRKRYSEKGGEEGGRLRLRGLQSEAPLLDLAAATLTRHGTRLFVIGKESPFQQNRVWEPYVDAEGHRWILPASRGAETPEVEVPIALAVRMDFHNRGRMVSNYVQSGYGTYDLAYLARISKGAYFMIDNSKAANRRPLSPSQRARSPLQLCFGVMERYQPLVVARGDYKKALFLSGRYGRRLWQLNEFFRVTKGSERRDRCQPTSL